MTTSEPRPSASEGADLHVNGVSFVVSGRAIVDNVSLAVAPGETLAVVGPSGCGKTTLLRLIAGLEQPSTGSVHFGGEDLAPLPVHKRRFGMMFQDFALFPHLNVQQNVAFGLRRRLGSSARAARVGELLDLVSLAGFGKRTIEALSGGERQRVALARAIAPEPRLLMLDEPLGSLDRGLRERLLIELKTILGRLQIPTLYVTHDQFEAFAVGTNMAVMRDGKIVRSDTPRAIFERPETAFVARFLGLDNIVAGERSADGMVTTVVGPRLLSSGAIGPVQVLLRNEGVAVVPTTTESALHATLTSRLFQGVELRVQLATVAGPLEFALSAGTPLPLDGQQITLSVPNLQVLSNGDA